jgi:hypothetical protein
VVFQLAEVAVPRALFTEAAAVLGMNDDNRTGEVRP